MKLYTTDASPFGARIRIQIYSKKLAIEILPPPGGLGSAELKQLSPTGKIPILDPGGSVIIESAVIQEYLEDKFPRPSLRGDSPEASAAIRMLGRLTDLYLVPALQPLRACLRAEVNGRENLQQGVEGLHSVLGMFELCTGGDGYAIGDHLSLADCAMAPLFLYVVYFAEQLDVDLSMESFPRLNGWWGNIRHDVAVDRVLVEMEATR